MSDSGRQYDRPANPPRFETCPRQLKPLASPPAELLRYLPPLPGCARGRFGVRDAQSEDIFRFFDISSHIIPAAFPRVTPFVSFSELERKAGGLAGSDSKETRSKRAATILEHLLQLRSHWKSGIMAPDGSENRLLWNVVNRYSRRSSNLEECLNRRAVTLLLTHANGMPKETWEPFLIQLCFELERHDSDVRVEEAWAIESVQHGDSFLINQDKMGVLFEWSEYARDILNFLRNYMPERSTCIGTESLYLPRVHEATSLQRIKHGFHDRTVIMVGHSFGGCASALAAVEAPRLFSSLILVDPMIAPECWIDEGRKHAMRLASVSLRRQERWTSREEALASFRKSPVFGAWHPSVIEKYVNYGLIGAVGDDGHLAQRLKTPGLQEAIVYTNVYSACETFEVLQNLDTQVDLFWVLALGNEWLTAEEEQLRMRRRPINCGYVCINSGHLVVQEAPRELAEEVSTFLVANLSNKKPALQYKL